MSEKKKYESYFNEICTEDIGDIITIAEVASREIYDRIHIKFDDPKLLVSTWSKIYDAILLKLVKLESEYSDFQINICDRLSIGYSTTDDEDDEKIGNFMISILHMNTDKKNNDVDDPEAKPSERAVHWNTENIIHQPDILRDISISAVEQLKSIEVELGTSEAIMPIFVMTYEALVKYLKIKRNEKNDFEFEINWASCFYIGARESEEGNDDIYIRPNINSKLMLKNDTKASSQYE